MKNAKPIKIPMGTNGHLNLDTGGKSIDQKILCFQYACVQGSKPIIRKFTLGP
jgi:hypothetical protein